MRTLFAALVVAGVGVVNHLYDKTVRLIDLCRRSDVCCKRQVATLVVAHLYFVYKHVANAVHRSEIEQYHIAHEAATKRKLGVVKQSFARFKLTSYARQYAFR